MQIMKKIIHMQMMKKKARWNKMTDTEKINAIKQLLKKYGFEFKEMDVSQIIEGMCYEPLYDIAEGMHDFLEFGSKLTEIINKE